MSLLRVYEPSECGPKGYPVPWERGDPRIPEYVRELAGHRCVRCQHPFVCGETPGRWSPCDDRCEHRGPARYRPGWSELGEGITDASDVDPFGPDTATPPEATAGELIDGGIDVEAEWRVLTVHHLTGDKLDCRWWNLMAACQRCHLEIQGRVRMERVYIMEHSEWMKPYAAGYYAATYLAEDLDREETMVRLDELLALEAV